jgi:hypothetical protein
MKNYTSAVRGAANQRVARAALVAHGIGSSVSLAGEAARRGVSSIRNPLRVFRSQYARNYDALSGTTNLDTRLNQRAGIRYNRPAAMSSEFVNTTATNIARLKQDIDTLKRDLASKMDRLRVLEAAQRAAKLQHDKNIVRHKHNSRLANRYDSRRAAAVSEQLAILNRANRVQNALGEIRALRGGS